MSDPSRQAFWPNALLAAFTTLLTLGALEYGLRQADFPPQTLKPEKVHDEVLLYRIPRDYPGTDREGFRNRDALASAEVVALGDSHTWGVNAQSHESWPSQFSGLTGAVVYNQGMGGHGPLQYLYLLDAALARKPRHVIVGFYSANDLMNVCDVARAAPYWQTRAPQEKLDLGYCTAGRRKPRALPPPEASMAAGIRLLSLTSIVSERARTALSKPDPDEFLVIDDGRNATLFGRPQLAAHRRWTDLGDQEIARSLEVTKQVLMRMARKCAAAGVRFAVMFVPSKEHAFTAYLRGHGAPVDAEIAQVAANEAAIRESLRAFLGNDRIPTVDAGPDVVASMAAGRVYPSGEDGHPLAPGYAAYARALHRDYWAKTVSSEIQAAADQPAE